jgi:copper chaperone CopZ
MKMTLGVKPMNKSKYVFWVWIVMMFACAFSAFSDSAKQCVLHVQGLFSRACVSTVQEALFSVSGVQSVDIDLNQQTARIHYDSQKTSPEALVEAVKQTQQYSAFVQK